MTLRTTFIGAALAVAAAAPLAAQELKFANFTPPFHTVNASVIEKLNADLTEATGGSLTVRGYHGGELGAGPVEQYVRAVQGVADMVWGLPGYTSQQFQKTMIVELPGVLPEGKTGADALCDAMDEISGEFPGTVPVALWTSEPNIMIMKDKAIRTPADLAGLKIRVAGATAGKVAEALGATPVQMPINQVYNAMQTGLIDGVFTGASTLSDFKLDEVADAYTLGAPLGRLAFFAVMGQGSYDALSDDAQAALDEARGCALGNNAETAWNATATEALETARADDGNTFVDLTEDEAQAFEEAVSNVVAEYVDSVGGDAALAAMQE
ncbi:TRAP transporter substrate-binding protein [Marivita sp.]|uniref:TRAP transporter substrate-binding protein n=1 Tax=Marivita sp. TaxID=2003365 RepID=UPI0025B8FD7C|nr:TRAP transporter substrate-binding protein [Marivita sp.]